MDARIRQEEKKKEILDLVSFVGKGKKRGGKKETIFGLVPWIRKRENENDSNGKKGNDCFKEERGKRNKCFVKNPVLYFDLFSVQ